MNRNINIAAVLGSCVNGVQNGACLNLGNIYQNTKLIVNYLKALLSNFVKITEVNGGNGNERV